MQPRDAVSYDLRDTVSYEPDYPFLRRVAAWGLVFGMGVLGVGFFQLAKGPRPKRQIQIPTIMIEQPPSIAFAMAAKATPEELVLAKAEVDAFAFQAYPMWATTGGACPHRLLDVNRFAPRLHAVDPWGTPYQFLCGDQYNGFTTRSAGPDRRFDTADDLTAGK